MKTRTVPRLRASIAEARTFELTGFYRDAVESLAPFWANINDYPSVEGFERLQQGELYLRCGSVAGFIGRFEGNSFALEHSKDLLMKARDIFIELDALEHLVAAENSLALSYQRTGECLEADVWMEYSFSRNVSTDTFERLESFVTKSQLLLDESDYEGTIEFLKKVESYFQDFDNDYLNGCFSTNIGIAYRRTNQIPEAMQMYTLARYYHKKSGHLVYLSTVENNLSYLYMHEGRSDLAFEYAYRSLEIIKKTGDLSRYGYTLDTVAELHLDKGELETAIEKVDQAIDCLRDGGIANFLINTLFTKVRIQMAMKKFDEASITFSECVQYARNSAGEDRVSQLAKRFAELIESEGYIGLDRILTERVIPGEQLELELPASLSRYERFEAVRIKTNNHSSSGLRKGTLALIVNTEVYSGDFVALVENGTDQVICGRIEKMLGLITIESQDMKPEIFEENNVEILGKIVGFADPAERKDGKLKVTALEQFS